MRRFASLLIALVLSLTPTASELRMPGPEAGIRHYTWDTEFDYLSWIARAAALKLGQATQAPHRFLDTEAQSEHVRATMALVQHILNAEEQLRRLHADPASTPSERDALAAELERLYTLREQAAPLAESILQAQVSAVFAEEGFAVFPPLLYHSTPLPWALIVSPRDHIAQQHNISLRTELTLADHIRIEDEVTAGMDVSALVVPVGGIGVYPTMVAQTSNLNWLVETIAHEWLHNYLTLRPLGFLYYHSRELTTMNETTATLAGRQVGEAVIARYYPERLPPPPPPVEPQTSPEEPPAGPPPPPVFDFRAEMHETRLQVDALLEAGQIDEAEAYMEARRLFFWEHGFAIRKLNQAYFAFYGSYADSPTGPAGADPVGAAVRELYALSPSLKDFVGRMAWLTSFEGLQSLLAVPES
ncbi:MAG: hypothetical protein KIS85_01110 [Anaerolineales bacterium]|nr:hypothetical protein [Anaerolineales bacterium]